MSPEFLLKPVVAPAAPKVENTKVSSQSTKPENTDEPSFSSTLDKQVEQAEPLKKESTENVEASAKHSDDELKEKITSDDSGNILPENTEAESETIQEPITELELMDENADVSTVTELKGEIIKPSATKLLPAEQLITVKVATADKSSNQSLNKEKTSLSPTAFGSNAQFIGKEEAAESLVLDKKPQTTNLRSDIFHALSKNKSSETIALDDLGNKALMKGSDRSQTNFATALTSATTLNAPPVQNNATPPAVLAVQPTMQSSAWNQVISSRVVWMAREGIQEASLKLNPANLGPVEVKLNMHKDQANVLFISHNAATRDALEQALPRLRESFAENGMQLADADVAGQGFEQTKDEQRSGESVHGHGELSSAETEAEQQSIVTEQNVDVGLSLYA